MAGMSIPGAGMTPFSPEMLSAAQDSIGATNAAMAAGDMSGMAAMLPLLQSALGGSKKPSLPAPSANMPSIYGGMGRIKGTRLPSQLPQPGELPLGGV